MNFIQKITGRNNPRTILSTLWIVVMFNMIFADISKVISYKASRWINIVAAVFTIPYIMFGGSLYMHYVFFRHHRNFVNGSWYFSCSQLA